MRAASELFREGRLSIGLVLPAREQDGATVDFSRQIDIGAAADRRGFDALWVRDVPLNGSWYPETFGHLDPFAMLGALSVRTSRIALGTAATVLPMRHPLHIAKSARSIATLSGDRFILGLGSGDREEEFAAFGRSFEDRRSLYSDGWARLRAALAVPSRVIPDKGSDADTRYELWPMSNQPIPMIAVGSGGQTLEWIARNADGWATYHRPADVQRDRYAFWRRAVDNQAAGAFRSFSIALRVTLDADPRTAAHDIELGYRCGAHALRAILMEMHESGVHHVLLNLVPSGRSVFDQVEELADTVLPVFGDAIT